MNVRRFVTLVLLMLACPALVWGDEICFVPSLAVNEEYNSNILLATEADNVRKDYITIISPGFEMADRTERFDSLLSLRLDRLQYSRNEELNATNQHYSGSIRYAATPLLNVSAEAGYTKDSNPSLWSATSSSSLPPGTVVPVLPVLPPPPTPIPTTGNSNTGGGNTSASMTTLPLVASPVQRISSSVSMDYRMTETTSLSAMYRFGWSSYEIPRYRDTSHDAQAGLVIDLGKYLPRVKGRLNTGYSQYLLPDLRTINVMGTIGFSYDVSETWSILVDGGLRRTDTEIFVNQLVPYGNQTPPTALISVRERLDHTERGGTGHLSLNYKGEYTGAELSYIQDFTMAYLASGRQAPAERKALSFTVRHQITRELSALLAAGYTTYTSAHVLTQNNVSISPIIRYDLAQMSGERDLALEASYEHTRIDYTASGTAYRDLYFIRLSVRFPYCSSSQYK
jgi:hypothetical protein